jgi:hypothetical protein
MHIFLFFRVVFYCFVCLCPVSCVPSVAGVPGLSFRDWPFGFLKRLFSVLAHDHMQYVPRYYIVHVKYAYLYIKINRLVILFSHLFTYVLLISKSN